VRIGLPYRIKGMTDIVKNSAYATSVGLLHYGLQKQQENMEKGLSTKSEVGLFGKLKAWVQNNF
jgi:cell division protein FtsA